MTNSNYEELNKNFYRNKSYKPSLETNILVKNSSILKKVAKDCLLTLHEDYDQKKFYLYVRNNNFSDKIPEKIVKTASRFFKILKNRKVSYFKVKKGISLWKSSDSLEQYLLDKGILRTICTETPRGFGIEKRIKANCSIMNTLVNCLITDNRKTQKDLNK